MSPHPVMFVRAKRTWNGELGLATEIAGVLASTVKFPVDQLETLVT